MPVKSLYSKRLSRVVSNGAQQVAKGKYHIISGTEKQWRVIGEGKSRSMRNFNTQAEAISFAKTAAKKFHGQVIVHSTTGQISKVITAA